MPKQVFIKPVLKLTDRQWRKLMARVFEREERASGQVAKYQGNEMPSSRLSTPENVDETTREMQMLDEEKRAAALQKWKDLNPRPEQMQPEPGHGLGGTLPAQQTTGFGNTSVLKDDLMHLMNPSGLEYPPEVSRRWKWGMEQSEDIAASVAQARNPSTRSKFIDDQEVLDQAAETVMRGPTPSKKGSLKDRRGIRSSITNPGALLPPNMQRAVQKGGHLPTAAEMMTFKPPEERMFGRLMRKTEEGESPLDLPWASAARMLHRDPESLRAFKGKVPPADVLKLRERGGSKYERRVFKPLEEEVQRSSAAVDEAAREAEREAKKASKLKGKQEAQVGASVDKVQGRIASPVNRDELFKEALLLDGLWKNFVGGGRTLTGRAWSEYLKDEMKRGRGTRRGMDARDYFQTVALKWLHEPEKAAKRYPREVRSLEHIIAEAEKEHGPIFSSQK